MDARENIPVKNVESSKVKKPKNKELVQDFSEAVHEKNRHNAIHVAISIGDKVAIDVGNNRAVEQSRDLYIAMYDKFILDLYEIADIYREVLFPKITEKPHKSVFKRHIQNQSKPTLFFSEEDKIFIEVLIATYWDDLEEYNENTLVIKFSVDMKSITPQILKSKIDKLKSTYEQYQNLLDQTIKTADDAAKTALKKIFNDVVGNENYASLFTQENLDWVKKIFSESTRISLEKMKKLIPSYMEEIIKKKKEGPKLVESKRFTMFTPTDSKGNPNIGRKLPPPPAGRALTMRETNSTTLFAEKDKTPVQKSVESKKKSTTVQQKRQ